MTNVASRVGTRAIQGMRGFGSKAGQVLTAPFRKAKDVFLRAKDAIRRRLIRTKPSGKPDPNAKPGGTRTKIPKKDTKDNQRNYELENESADALSQQGYNVEQNPRSPAPRTPTTRSRATSSTTSRRRRTRACATSGRRPRARSRRARPDASRSTSRTGTATSTPLKAQFRE